MLICLISFGRVSYLSLKSGITHLDETIKQPDMDTVIAGQKAIKRAVTSSVAPDRIVPSLTKDALAERADILCRALKKNPHQPLGVLLRRQGIKADQESLLEAITAIHSEFRESLNSSPLDATLPTNKIMLHALCDFVLGCQKSERANRHDLASKPGRAPLLLLECLGALSDSRVTSDKTLSGEWQKVRTMLDKLVVEKTRSENGKSAFAEKLTVVRTAEPIETPECPLTPLERLMGFDLDKGREATSGACQILRLAKGDG